jgi:hypothetical protein
MRLIQRTREWARLPKMPAESVFHVELCRVRAVTAVQRSPNRIFAVRNGNQMDVGAHEAVCTDAKTESSGAFPEQADIDLTVGIIAKDIESSDSALGYM